MSAVEVAAGVPGGYVESHVLTQPNPAAGAGLTFQVPGAVYWRPISIVFTLVTSAGVADRYVTVEYRDFTATTFLVNAAAVVVTASTTQRFAGDRHRAVAEWNTGADVLFPLAPVWLTQGQALVVAITGIQAADQLSAIRLAVEQVPVGG